MTDYKDVAFYAREIIQECWNNGHGDAIDFTCNVINITSVSMSLQNDFGVCENDADEAAYDAAHAWQFASWANF